MLLDIGEPMISLPNIKRKILKLSLVGGMDCLSRFACLTPIAMFGKYRSTYYLVLMRNIRTGITSFPASDAVIWPSLGEQVTRFPTGAAGSARRCQAARLLVTQQESLSSVASLVFEAI